MITSAIMGGLILSMMSYLRNIIFQTNNLTARVEAKILGQEIRQMLSNSKSCFETFKDKNALNTPMNNNVTNISKKSKNGITQHYFVYSAANKKKYGEAKLKIIGYELKGEVNPQDDELGIDASDDIGNTNLKVAFIKGKMKRPHTYNIKLSVTVDATTSTNSITGCQALGDSSGASYSAYKGRLIKCCPNPLYIWCGFATIDASGDPYLGILDSTPSSPKPTAGDPSSNPSAFPGEFLLAAVSSSGLPDTLEGSLSDGMITIALSPRGISVKKFMQPGAGECFQRW